MKSSIKQYVTGLAIPRGVQLAVAGFAGLVMSLVVTSLAVSNVIAHQGFENYALAKPTATQRVIRQTQVDRFGGQVSSAFGIKNSVATEFADWILEAAERQDLAPELLASLVLTESSFRKHARSNVGAVGPAQIRPDYWGSFCGADDLHDPEQNIYCGAQILSHLMERCGGDRACALAAYNVGPYANRASAAARYVTKVDRYQDSLEAHSLEAAASL
ncbi:MAG: transglycosylase SLT domain-containing protein [Pseudomonadales bacterium]|nr:transglycosylase SLT domain-containing protein [Pseudomonadales bacterium]